MLPVCLLLSSFYFVPRLILLTLFACLTTVSANYLESINKKLAHLPVHTHLTIARLKSYKASKNYAWHVDSIVMYECAFLKSPVGNMFHG
jgi:hypothetical protein